MTNATQREQVLDYLKRQGDDGITPLQALVHLSCFRLAARIYELRQLGHNVVDAGFVDMTGRRVSRYVLLPSAVSEPVVETEHLWSCE